GALLDPLRRAALGRVPARLDKDPLKGALTDKDRASIRASIDAAFEEMKRADPALAAAQRAQVDTADLAELESFLVEAREAEAKGDARTAARAYRTLRERYKGDVLRDFFEERTKHFDGAVTELASIEKATQQGDAAAAQAALARLHAAYPEVHVDLKIPFEIVTVPPGARLTIDGNALGSAPKIVQPETAGAVVRAEMEGYEPVETKLGTGGGAVSLLLPRVPVWRARLEGAASGAGTVTGTRWILADRRGSVRAVDGASGNELWSRRFETLGGIAGVPALLGARVAVATREGAISLLDSANGEIVAAQSAREATIDGVVAAHGVVAWATAERFVVWRPDAQKVVEVAHRARPTTSPVASATGFAIGASDGSVLAFEPNGELRWRAGGTEPIRFLAPSHEGWISVAGSEVARLSDRDGRPLATKTLRSSPLSAPVVGEDGLLYVGLDGALLALDASSLEIRKTLELPDVAPQALLPLREGFMVGLASEVRRIDGAGQLRWARPGTGRPFLVRLGESTAGAVFESGEVCALPTER
ncbi:MAG TPA: PQQ-binding-like beta-propeller repeat protein, partial [Planctomycetota bacterium]|nr:PQQ-binding-like beta-propeller repeat protein [Planctomycetota bacterium]